QRSLESITTLNGAVRDGEASTQVVLDNVADGIVTLSEGGVIESFNRSAQALFGYREEDVIGQPLTLVIAPARRGEFCGLTTAARGRLPESGAKNRPTETLGCRQDGSTFPMELEHGEMKLGDRSLTLAFVRDISERKAYTEGLEHQALHDGLTGLANRTLFGEHLLQSVASAKRNDESRAVLVMDLDGFKQVSERLVAALRQNDIIARLGGDEFGILPGGATDLAAAAAVAWKIQQTCMSGFEVRDEVVHVSASVGIAVFPDHGKTTAELLRRADA